MLLIEKVLILRSSDIFRNTPENELVELAGILEEVHFDAGVTLFSKGDHGNFMYFIHKGSIRVHDGDHTLAILDENQIVGELSILDADTRSASATTREDCFLLKLEHEPFYEIMLTNVEILKGILKTLCRRLRVLNEKSVIKSHS